MNKSDTDDYRTDGLCPVERHCSQPALPPDQTNQRHCNGSGKERGVPYTAPSPAAKFGSKTARTVKGRQINQIRNQHKTTCEASAASNSAQSFCIKDRPKCHLMLSVASIGSQLQACRMGWAKRYPSPPWTSARRFHCLRLMLAAQLESDDQASARRGHPHDAGRLATEQDWHCRSEGTARLLASN